MSCGFFLFITKDINLYMALLTCAASGATSLLFPSMSQALSCFTLSPPQPSWENSASRTDWRDSKCFEVELWDGPDPDCPEPELDELSLFGKPFPAAAAHDGGGALFWVVGPPGAWDAFEGITPEVTAPGVLLIFPLGPLGSSRSSSKFYD